MIVIEAWDTPPAPHSESRWELTINDLEKDSNDRRYTRRVYQRFGLRAGLFMIMAATLYDRYLVTEDDRQ